jgi:pteridine reductase
LENDAMQPNDKVALVTGSGKRRVGNAIVEALAARGYQVAVHYHRSAAEARQTVLRLKEQGLRAQAFQAEVTDEAAVERLFEQIISRFGRLDVLVTAAAIWEPKRLEDVTAADLRRYFDVNALGTFLCCRRAGLIMAGQPEGGAIVTLGDWATERPYANYAAYFPSKGAVPAMTRSLAVELALRNPAVRVNCILPGPVLLPPGLSEDERREAIAGTLVRREGRPENVAHAVLFLVENEFVTGVCLPVDGGRTIAGG